MLVEGEAADAAYPDLRIVFDTVIHSILAAKLLRYNGIGGLQIGQILER